MINAVIPMAGAGSRFARAGYSQPKYLIEVAGKFILEHSLSSLPLGLIDRLYFVALDSHARTHDLHGVLSSLLRVQKFHLLTLPAITKGRAETVLKARDYIDSADDLIIFNIDTYYQSSVQHDLLTETPHKHDGFLGAAAMPGEGWSFVVTDAQGFVARTAEKVCISPHALTGLYHFSKGSDFVAAATIFS